MSSKDMRKIIDGLESATEEKQTLSESFETPAAAEGLDVSEFNDHMYAMLEDMKEFLSKHMNTDAGSTAEESQYVGLIEAINEVEYLVNGTEQSDLI